MDFLKIKYKKLCEEYLRLFCEKHELSNDGWIAGRHGETAVCGDLFVDFKDIIHDIDNDIEVGKWEEYDDYASKSIELGLNVPTFENFLNGCYRTSEEKFEKLFELKKQLFDMIEDEKKNLKT